MTTHLKKQDIKNPDIVTLELKKGFQWTRTHAKLTLFLSLAFLAVGIGYSIYQYFSEQAETAAQESFYKVELEYLKLQDSAKPKTEKNKPTPAPVVVDYEPVAQKFAAVISNHSSSRAALLAFLDYSEIKVKNKNYEDVIKSSEKLKLGSDLLSALVLMEKGNAEANSKNCQQAITTWEKILSLKSSQSIYPEVHLQQALCYESLNNGIQAEANYNKVLAEAKDSAAAKSAEKYLRLLKSKVN